MIIRSSKGSIRSRGSGRSRGSKGRRRLAATVAVLAVSTAAHGAELTPAAISAWDGYVQNTEARRAREESDDRRFLVLDFRPDATSIRQTLLRGELLVHEGGTQNVAEIGVPDGTIHHWRGAIFVPGRTLSDLIATLRDPQRHGYKAPDVLKWQVLRRDGDRERVFLQIQRQQIVTAVFNTEHDVQFIRHNADRVSSRSMATRIAEVTAAGTPEAREKPVGRDRGFLWRMNSYWRYEAVPGGILVELESLTLSRSVPGLLRPLARPIISRVARESLERTLGSIRDQIGRPPV
jgi:hypothetical protein